MKIKRIKAFYGNISLKKRIFAMMMIVTAVEILFGIVLNVTVVRQVFAKKSLSYTNEILIGLQSRINSNLSGIEDVSQNIIYNTEIYDILSKNIDSDAVIEKYEYQRRINYLLKDMVFFQHDIQSVILYNQQEYSYAWDADNDLSCIDRIPDVIIQEHNQAKPKWIVYDNNLYLVRDIRNKDTFSKIGHMIIVAKKNMLNFEFADVKTANQIILLNEKGETLSSSNYEKDLQLTQQQFAYNIKDKHGYFLNRKLKSMISFIPITDMGWSLIIMTPISVLYKELNYVTMLLILFGFLMTIIIVAVNRIFSKDLLSAINELTDRMQAFEKSGIADVEKSERRDEFGYLTNRFSEMTLQITRLIDRVYKEKIYRKNAQIKALQAQINPHFLYNTLETINWMAQLKGASEVSDMIGSLSALLSAGIDNTPRLIPLEQELSYVKDYCDIIKFRYRDGIQFRYNIDENCKYLRIPCLSLQPLVENAVLRGIDPSFRDGKILIKAYIQFLDEKGEKCFVLKVADNGVGIAPERLKEINEYLSLKKEPDIKGHVGLVNVARRIKLFYGEQAEMKIESRTNFYCCVSCIIPLEALESTYNEKCEEDQKI